ncbi:hypothetical protein [Rhizobium sp. SG2393]|uniref:hypothetical protein n=1 Tax=Rhizobium sp. SG2393 TaxID=3276279 RepID=UPI00366DB0C8
MNEAHSKPRQRAEIAFQKEQAQFFARGEARQEEDAITLARDEKTLRLRQARLARDHQNSLTLATKPAAKRARRA